RRRRRRRTRLARARVRHAGPAAGPRGSSSRAADAVEDDRSLDTLEHRIDEAPERERWLASTLLCSRFGADGLEDGSRGHDLAGPGLAGDAGGEIDRRAVDVPVP